MLDGSRVRKVSPCVCAAFALNGAPLLATRIPPLTPYPSSFTHSCLDPPLVLEILGQTAGTIIKSKEWNKVRAHEESSKKVLAPSESHSDSESEPEEEKKVKVPSVRVPGKTAIAGVLISKFAHRELEGLGYSFPLQVGAKPKI